MLKNYENTCKSCLESKNAARYTYRCSPWLTRGLPPKVYKPTDTLFRPESALNTASVMQGDGS